MVMDERATYVSPLWDRFDLYLRPGLTPPNTLQAVDDETGEDLVFTRLSDDSLTCHPALLAVTGTNGKTKEVMTKCGREECHRKELGKCQCGLHPDFLHPSGKMSRGVKVERHE